MLQPYIPSFGIKDPNDTLPKNFDAASALASLGNPSVTTYSVFVDGCLNADGSLNEDGTTDADDGALVISNVAWNATLKRVSFSWSGGTPGRWYRVTCRVSGIGFSRDQSAKVFIANK